VPTPENPMRRNPLMQLMVANFHNCRTTPEGLLSVLDAIRYVKGSSREASKWIWGFRARNSQGIMNDTLGISVDVHQFSTRGGHKTPVATCSALLRILALVPEPAGDSFRKVPAELAARSVAGDHDLEEALSVRRENLGVEGPARVIARSVVGTGAKHGETLSVPAPENPVRTISWMQRTATDFQSYRTTPDGYIRGIDGMTYFRECSQESAKRYPCDHIMFTSRRNDSLFV